MSFAETQIKDEKAVKRCISLTSLFGNSVDNYTVLLLNMGMSTSARGL